jgi:hypothetical protein
LIRFIYNKRIIRGILIIFVMSENKKTVKFQLPIEEFKDYSIQVMEINNSNTSTESSDISSVIKKSFESGSPCLTDGNLILDDSREETKNDSSNSTIIVVAEKSTESSNQSDSSIVGTYTAVVAKPSFPTIEVYPGYHFKYRDFSHFNAFYMDVELNVIVGKTTSTYEVYLFAYIGNHTLSTTLGKSAIINVGCSFSGYCGASDAPGK